MLRSLFSGIGGLKVHQVRLDVVSNNIANVNTTGYKASRVRFSDVLSQTVEIATSPNAGRGGQNPKQIGLGVVGTTITRDMGQGAIEVTNRDLDLAIQGNGFFILRDGEAVAEHYTRDGHFSLDADGNITYAVNGYRVQGWNAERDTLSQAWTIDSTAPVEDLQVNLSQQMDPIATTEVSMAGNIDSRLNTAIDPVRVSWMKNGTEREVEFRFFHVHPTRNLFQWEVYDPTNINAATGDFTQLTTADEANGIEPVGIIELDDNGRVIANYVNTNVAADPASRFLDVSELPDDGDRWALNRATNTFNGYDFITLTTENDGDEISQQDDEAADSVTEDATALTITADWEDGPFAQQASANFPNGFAVDAIPDFTVGTAGTAGVPGNDLGVPVQIVNSVSNEVADGRVDVNYGGGTIRTNAQLDFDNIISTRRNNPDRQGIMGQPGTDNDSVRVMIDGVEYTEVTAFGAYPSNEFRLNADSGIIEINRQIGAGVNIIVSYDYESRAQSEYTVTTNTTIAAAFGAPGASFIQNGTADTNGAVTRQLNGAPDNGDGSQWFVGGSGGTMTITDVTVAGEGTQNFIEVPYLSPSGTAIDTAGELGANRYSINPTTGEIFFGTFSGGAAVAGADLIAAFTFGAYRGSRDNNGNGAGAPNVAITGVGGIDNRFGRADLWRLQTIPAGGADTATARIYLQGDYTGVAATANPDAETLDFFPLISSATPNRRLEMNYEADDRVNVIIPNGITKMANPNPLTNLTDEAFLIEPNTTQVTAGAGNNNQADTGDSVGVNVNEPDEYRYSTAVQVFDSLGTAWNVPIRFEKLSTNQWLMYAIDPTDPDGERIALQRLIAFDSEGNFDSTSTIPYEAPTADGTANDGFEGIYFDPAQAGGAAPPEEGADPVRITLNFANLSQTARTSSAVADDQNGMPAGKLETFSFNQEGFLVGLFDNGESLNLGRIALQGFVNPAGLVAEGGNMFRDTVNAGKFGSPQRPGFDGVGTIVAGGLENSNVDLSVEFVDLIVTQRGFQAQSRSITTADQVLQEVLGLKR